MSQRDFARIREALKQCHVANLVLVVLTLDPRRAPETLEEQYKGLEPRWKGMQKYLSRGWVDGKIPALGKFDFVSTVEAHRSGQPHLNVIIHSRELAQLLRARPPTPKDKAKKRGPRWFRDLAAHVGWGPLAFIGHATSKDDVASYVTKLEKGTTASPTLVGEVVKNSQLPVMAPRRMRRVRSSKGFLPPARLPTDPEWTGQLFQHPTPALQQQAQAEGLTALLNHMEGRHDATTHESTAPTSGGSLGGRMGGAPSWPVGDPRHHLADAVRRLFPAGVAQVEREAGHLRADRLGGRSRGLCAAGTELLPHGTGSAEGVRASPCRDAQADPALLCRGPERIAR